MIFLPSKTELDNMIRGVATECESRMQRWEMFALKIDAITDAQLLAMGYSQDNVNYIRSFATALKNIELKYRNQAPLNSDDPSYFVGLMTAMLVI